MFLIPRLLHLAGPLLLAAGLMAQDNARESQQREFFENRIRPVLAQECYNCHSEAGKQKADLLLDSRSGWQKGGESGPVIVPGDPDKSLLMQSISHEHPQLQMPKNGAKLDDQTLADFRQWIAQGAFDPRDQAPSAEELKAQTDWPAVFARRRQWWAFSPLKSAPQGKGIDDYLDEAMRARGVEPAPPASAEAVARRQSLVLTGLPPNSKTQGIDALMASPAFGEKWARHFMDWVRYAESYGSEGDPAIPYAHEYRDYLIRALNADVPWPQLLREAIAGDLLIDPRVSAGINESMLGIGHLRMVLHGFSPVDSLDEFVTFTDNQIDTVTKAFQGLTVSCARCHHHKFDAISQDDYYALFGVFGSTHPAVVDATAPGSGQPQVMGMERLKPQIRSALAKRWLLHLGAPVAPSPEPAPPWGLRTRFEGMQWTAAGEFAVALEGPQAIKRIYTGGYVSDRHSDAARAVLHSAPVVNPGGKLWFWIAGGGGVKAKYVVQNYPRTGTIHKAIELKEAKDAQMGWRSLDLDFWKGEEIFIQVTTAADAPAEFREDRSWFILGDAMIIEDGSAPPALPQISKAPLAALVAAWRDGRLDDGGALRLQLALDRGELPNDFTGDGELAGLMERYRELERNLPVPRRAPGVMDGPGRDSPLFVRGNPRELGEPVERRYLEVIDPRPLRGVRSGRRELAERMANLEANPLAARVIVNRLWHHVFGRGLVASTDNFGKLGDRPSHPELLDMLASTLIKEKGSLKAVLKLMVESRAFARASSPTPSAWQNDPQNLLLSHWNLRRLEAESLRDSLLAHSGALKPEMYGKSVAGSEPRRSVYVKVVRNALDPLLKAFDAPVPFSACGRRDSTNVPAQSLTLLNDPLVQNWSAQWAARVLAEAKDDQGRVQQLYRDAFHRKASDEEIAAALELVSGHLADGAKQAQERQQLQGRQSSLHQQIHALLASLPGATIKTAPASDLPQPLAEWTFETGAEDERGGLDLKLSGDARIEGGALIVGGAGMAATGALPKTLRAKTLEAWVQLDDLTQQGGGVLTVQGMDAVLFDSVVFGEKQPGHWVAGSNFFARSELLKAPAESTAQQSAIHIAAVWEKDGHVSMFRNGKPYGQRYRKAEGAVFEAAKSQILVGCRHGKPAGNHGLRGRILRARVYDRALKPEELAKTASLEAGQAAWEQILAAMPKDKRGLYEKLQGQLRQIEQALEALPADQGNAPQQAWAALAHALVNAKEFSYLP
jgi:hypothetical protein